jgi:hypothetical protein
MLPVLKTAIVKKGLARSLVSMLIDYQSAQRARKAV